MEFEDLVLEFDEILEGHARKECCENKTGGVKRGKDSRLSCSCLHILRDHNLRDPVARFMARNVHRDKREIDEQLLDWYRYSKNAAKEMQNKYYIPYDGSVAYDAGEDISVLRTATLCTSSMYIVMDMSLGRMKPIMKAYNTTGVVKAHGNTGKSTEMKDDDPRMAPLIEHYDELLELGEVRATKLITSLVEGRQQTTLRDDEDDENVYLPTASGYRSCYYRYMKDQGYTAKPQHDGAIVVTWDRDPDADRAPSNYPKAAAAATATTDTNADDFADPPLDDSHDDNWRKPHVSFATYYRYWKRLYPQLKVSKPAEDICVKCYQFAMRHKMLAAHKANSSANLQMNSDEDDLLF